jgi:hypothetical protein
MHTETVTGTALNRSAAVLRSFTLATWAQEFGNTPDILGQHCGEF